MELLTRHDGTFEAVVEDSGHWRDLSRERMLDLRLIKNELGALVLIAESAAMR
ncbi:hypothetical protein ACTD5D_31080 [Nocardia takedensis]|uniref:hypothetical protein n=1 Tax=Nocardia takedensis TaxID=259390 RepID=UPI00031543F8|nr:hypothetical protein [Nocardia takedensis]